MKSMFKGIAVSLAMLIFCLMFFSKPQIVSAAEGTVTDLSNPDFGQVTDIAAPDSISDINLIFTLGFGFHIYDAKSFPDGTFTYTFPDSLDFSQIAGTQIAVSRDDEQIGYAVINSENIITFHLNPEDFADEPNGVDGNVAILCRLGDEFDDDAGEAEVRFSDTQVLRIVIDKSVEPDPGEDPKPEEPSAPGDDPSGNGSGPSFSLDLAKEIVKSDSGSERDPSTGIVNWKSTFTVDGEGDGYELLLTDSIMPNGTTGYGWLNGKRVGAAIVKDSVKVYASGGEEVSDVSVTYKDYTFEARLKNLSNGEYTVTYSTCDFYDSKDNHVFPGGSTITFNNVIKSGTPGVSASASASYEVSTEGLPMYKSAVAGRYDAELKTYVIPWVVYVNRNVYGQSISSLEDGAAATVSDILPEQLKYMAGSCVITDASGNKHQQEPNIDGNTLTWKYTWGSYKYSKISFDTYVDKEYYDNAVSSSVNGSVSLRFTNKATGIVGSHEGDTQATSNDSIKIIEKTGSFNDKTQRVDYTIVINSKALLLNEGKDLTLTDEVSGGAFVTGSFKVYDANTGEEIALDESKLVFGNRRTKLTAVVPDGKALTVKYSVAPDTGSGTDAGNGKVSVEVKNSANLLGKTSTKAGVGGKYIMNKVSANVTSKSGSLTVTKTEKENAEKKLAGAEIALYRVDLETKEETLVSSKTTSDPLGFVKFSQDGNYKSLIFDTLYYYREVKAPGGYKLDGTKHYFIFASTKYQNIKDKVLSASADGDLKVIDVATEGSEYEVQLENEVQPVRADDPVKDPGTGGSSNDSAEDTSSGSNERTTTAATTYLTVSPADLPEVLGASRDDLDLPEVLGARRPNTGDESSPEMAVLIIMLSLIVIGLNIRKMLKTTH